MDATTTEGICNLIMVLYIVDEMRRAKRSGWKTPRFVLPGTVLALKKKAIFHT
jgi:hypothetical protein